MQPANNAEPKFQAGDHSMHAGSLTLSGVKLYTELSHLLKAAVHVSEALLQPTLTAYSMAQHRLGDCLTFSTLRTWSSC